MANIRVLRLSVRSSTQIDIVFTSYLNENLGIDNVEIKAAAGTQKDLTIKSVLISNETLSIFVRPMVSKALYKVELKSSSSQEFIGLNGEKLIEDGATNHIFFTGKEDQNEIRDAILSSIESQKVYNTNDTMIRDIINSISDPILQAKHATREARSANFISVTVENEPMFRGSGPTDRFANEGVFQLLRAGKTISGATTNNSLIYSSFPDDPISLQQINTNEEVSNIKNITNKFEGLVITVSNQNIIKITSVILVKNTTEYIYDINQYRYGIKESKYDTYNAYPAFDLENNQIRLSSSAIGPSFPFPQGNDIIKISYLYKKEGRIIESSTINITSIVSVSREHAPSVITTFFLDHAPIVDENGEDVFKGGITWLDPAQNFDPTKKHPAFLVEISFNESVLPVIPGEWCIDYSNGRVIVAGVDGSGTDGTTTIPPVASYYYKRTFVEGFDYNFYSDLNEIASVPGKNLDNSEEASTISFRYEDTYADGTDFIFNSHIESLNERINNRIISNVGLKTLHSPVTDVFRIYNETTGEIYKVSRVDDDNIYFNAINPPNLKDIKREFVEFDKVTQEQLIVSDITNNIFKISLSYTNIVNSTGDYIGVNFNTSLEFSDTDIFSKELYYIPSLSLSGNILRLASVGDYIVNYNSGTIYVLVLSNSDTDIGNVSYRHASIKTRNKHITSISDVYRSPNSRVSNIKSFTLKSFEDETVDVKDLEQCGEINNNNSAILVQTISGKSVIYPSLTPTKVRSIYSVPDLYSSTNPVDFSNGITIQSDGYVELNSTGVSVIDEGLKIKWNGSRLYIDAERLQYIRVGLNNLASLVDSPDPAFIRRNYSVVGQDGTDYFSLGSDGDIDIVHNRIILPSSVSISYLGTTVTGYYLAKLLDGAAVNIDYTPGDIYIDYTYLRDEILVSYEYGDNNLDWSISDTISENETYYVSYKYGALRQALIDNFGILTSVEELTVIPETLTRETYRDATAGALQSFMKGPTIPSIKQIVSEVTKVSPDIIERVFEEWILGKNYLSLSKLNSIDSSENIINPTYVPGKFNNGVLVNNENQSLIIPATSNMRFAEGTWEAFVIPKWAGVENDATLTFDLKFDGYRYTDKIFIGSSNTNPTNIPFSLNKTDSESLGRPTDLRIKNGTFIWFDINSNKWHIRMRAPISEERLFSGTISTSGQFNDVKLAMAIDGYGDDTDGYESINEVNDYLTSTDAFIKYRFVVDSYDVLNIENLDSYGSGFAAYDGIDFLSDNLHYFFDSGVDENHERISLYKDGRGFLRLKVFDSNGRLKTLSANIKNWDYESTHHIAASWKIRTFEQKDELHLFVDGTEASNTYRFYGPILADGYYMDGATQTLISSSLKPILGSFDLKTVAGSNIVTSAAHDFIAEGITVGDTFIILEENIDGVNSASSTVTISTFTEHSLTLEQGGFPFNLTLTLNNVNYSINQETIETKINPLIEKVRIFSKPLSGEEFELYSQGTIHPDYSFVRDGYQDYITLNNGVSVGSDIYLRTYGLVQQTCKQRIYTWNGGSNIIKTIMPNTTSVSKIKITSVLVPRQNIELGSYVIISTLVGGHLINVLINSLNYCQPTETINGRRFSVTINGSNFDFSGLNEVKFVGTIYGGSSYTETVVLTETEKTKSTEKFFTHLTDVIAVFTPNNFSKPAGSVEIKETLSITEPENGGNSAAIYLSISEQSGFNGIYSSPNFSDAYARFGPEDVNKKIVFTKDGYYGTISNIVLTGDQKDSYMVELTNVNIPSPYSFDGYWEMLNISYSDSGFSNGLITLEIEGSGGAAFNLTSCTYDVEFPSFLVIPWNITPENLYIGSDINGKNQANAVIDELRILSEISDDTGNGETVSSSGRSITTDYTAVREYITTPQTLALFHFNKSLENDTKFLSSFSQGVFQSENSVNSDFGQSAVFDRKNGQLNINNNAVFQNDEGTIEFWVSPLVDTYNDPTQRYYIDLSPEQTVEATVISPMIVTLPVRARSISYVKISGLDTNYYTGGSLSDNGKIISLGQPLPPNIKNVNVTYTPINSNGDRFSIFKDENGILQLSVSASGLDYQISVPIFWKRGTWHRIYAAWNLNNQNNQDRLVFMIDGSEKGIIRYGTGLLYGSNIIYGMPTVFGSGLIGTSVSRNILADINLNDLFNKIHVGGDYTGQYPAIAKMDNIRFSNSFRNIYYLGGSGPGQLLGQDLLYTSNINTAQPVISDALTTLLLNFNNSIEEVKTAEVRDQATGIFDFFVKIYDSFNKVENINTEELIEKLIKRLKPAHTRAFVSFND